LNVLVPTAGGDVPGTPTGIVFNGSTLGAVYTGLAITSHTSGNILFAADNAVFCIIRDQQRVAERSEILGRYGKTPGPIQRCALRQALEKHSGFAVDIDKASRTTRRTVKRNVEQATEILNGVNPAGIVGSLNEFTRVKLPSKISTLLFAQQQGYPHQPALGDRVRRRNCGGRRYKPSLLHRRSRQLPGGNFRCDRAVVIFALHIMRDDWCRRSSPIYLPNSVSCVSILCS